MMIKRGTLVTHKWATGYDGELERGIVKEDCEDSDIFMMRVKFNGDKRSRWVKREELTIHKGVKDGGYNHTTETS